jgi:predicted nucleic acid-binding protein
VNAVFLDTVGMLALWDESDQWHEQASEARARFRLTASPVVTTTYVLLECGNAAARRPYRKAVSVFREVMVANNGLIVPSENDWHEAWQAYDLGGAGAAGIVDQLSFIVMRRLGLKQSFTNDWHFKAAGFETLF